LTTNKHTRGSLDLAPKVRQYSSSVTPFAAVILRETAVECGAITSLSISADHTTVAAGHANGNIFTWEIARSARPFLHIQPIELQHAAGKRGDGHISGVAVLHVGFLGTRHTALVSVDDRGMAFSHLATRGMGAVARTVRTTRILGRYPDGPSSSRPRKPSSVLAFSPLPLGNAEQPTDSMGLVAMLTPYLLVIVSTTPVAQTQHKAARPKEVAAHGAMSAALAWFPAIRVKSKESEVSKTKLVYCWSNVLTVLDLTEAERSDPADKDKPPNLQFKARNRWRSEEAIVAVQWLSRSVLSILTITQQLIILEDHSMRVTDSFDLLHKHIYHVDLFSKQLHALVEQLDEEDSSMHGVVADAFYMSFRAYKGRLFLLGFNDIAIGSLSNWADRLLALMEAGDFIEAIRLGTSYYNGDAEKLTIGLPEDDALRHPLVEAKLHEMISASLKYAFGRNQQTSGEQLGKIQLEELGKSCVDACVSMDDTEFLFDEVYQWYEDHSQEGLFLELVEPHILRGIVHSMPPTAVKALINHYTAKGSDSRLEELLCLLDTSTMDIDQVTTLCKQYHLFDAYIYVWNRALLDYTTPLVELLKLAPSRAESQLNGGGTNDPRNYTSAMKIFPYLSYVLTSRIYPTGVEMSDEEAINAKSEIYNFFFSGRSASAAKGSVNGRGAKSRSQAEASFPYLRKILTFDAASFLSALNEAFEDSFLNDSADRLSNGSPRGKDSVNMSSINRQYLISILLEVMNLAHFSPDDTIYLDMFIARSLPKYPQYILLSGTTLHQVLVRLCDYPNDEVADDCQLSAEYLLSMYHPPDLQSLIPTLRKARFFRVLKSIYKSEKRYSELIKAYFEDSDDQDGVFECIRTIFRRKEDVSQKQLRDVVTVIKDNARDLVSVDVAKTARMIEEYAPDLHGVFLTVLEDESHSQYIYLQTLLEPKSRSQKEGLSASKQNHKFVERYVQQMCQFNPSHVADFVDVMKVGDLRLEEVLPSMEQSGIVDAAVVLMARQGQVKDAMDRLIRHLGTLEAAMIGILPNMEHSPDAASTDEAIRDLLESLKKYTDVGVWLCQGQTKTAQRARSGMKPAKRTSATAKQQLSFEETLWLDLIEVVVRVAKEVFGLLGSNQHDASLPSQDSPQQPTDTLQIAITTSLRALVQQVFTALLTSTTTSRAAPSQPGVPSPTTRPDLSFLLILRSFLTRAASTSASLSELRAVLSSIFSAYAYEESLLSLANSMLDKDLFVHVDEAAKLRMRGWRPRGQTCGGCGRRVWGPGAGAGIWEAWERKQGDERKRRESVQAERRRSEGDGLEDRGKGKGVADREAASSLLEHGASSAPAGGDGVVGDAAGSGGGAAGKDNGDLGPVVVFSCRHVVHQRCLVQSGALTARDSGSIQRPELACPVCSGGGGG
jgi:vacuolar protein sorting-associated protein 8